MHGSLARAAAAYKQVQVDSRSPLELVVMLYDGALGSLAQARDAVESRDLSAKRNAVSRAMAILAHLQGTLNHEDGKEVAGELDRLYDFVVGLVVEGNVRLQTDRFEEAIRVLRPLRDAWAEVAAREATGGR